MLRKSATALLALTAVMAAGCANYEAEGPRYEPRPIGPPPPPPPPPPAATILGHGDFHTRAGGHGDCEGLSVALMHDTPSFRARILALYGSVEGSRLPVTTVKARSARLGPATENPLAESVTCDPMGAFVFRDIQAGSYFIIARVKLITAQGAAQDLVVMRHVDVSDGDVRDVWLAP